MAYSSSATERCCPKWYLGQKVRIQKKKNLTKASFWMEIACEWKAPSWIALLDRIAYRIRNSVDRNYLGLKGSILDGLDHVVGQVEGEERLVELETIVNRPHLCNFSSTRFVQKGGESWFVHDHCKYSAIYSLCLNCANVCLCKSLSELQIFKLTRSGGSISSRHCLS